MREKLNVFWKKYFVQFSKYVLKITLKMKKFDVICTKINGAVMKRKFLVQFPCVLFSTKTDEFTRRTNINACHYPIYFTGNMLKKLYLCISLNSDCISADYTQNVASRKMVITYSYTHFWLHFWIRLSKSLQNLIFIYSDFINWTVNGELYPIDGLRILNLIIYLYI